MIETFRAACASLGWLALIAPCAAADTGADAGFQACRAIADATARLACFDRASGPTPVPAAAPSAAAPAAAPSASALPAVAAPAAATVPPAVPSPATAAHTLNPEQQFGLPEKTVVAKEVAAGTRAADAAKLQTRIALIIPAADRRLVFMLDNNQVWQQLTLEGEMLAKQGDDVTISRGLLGSYWLQLPSGRGCKVTRLR
jgi:hypothetical protein